MAAYWLYQRTTAFAVTRATDAKPAAFRDILGVSTSHQLMGCRLPRWIEPLPATSQVLWDDGKRKERSTSLTVTEVEICFHDSKARGNRVAECGLEGVGTDKQWYDDGFTRLSSKEDQGHSLRSGVTSYYRPR